MGYDWFEIKNKFLTRRSIREYSSESIPQEVFGHLLEIAQSGPKAGGIDCVKIRIIESEDEKNICFKAAFYQDFVRNAPYVAVFSIDAGKLREKYKDEKFFDVFSSQNAAIAAQNMIIAANEVGIGTCWIGGVRRDYLQQYLKMDSNNVPWVLITMGFLKKKEHKNE